MRREQVLSLLAGPLLTVAASALFWLTDLDIRLQRLAYSPIEPHWPYAARQPWAFVRDWATWPGLLLAVGAIVVLALSYTSDSARRWRYPSLFIFLFAAMGPGLVTNLLGKALFGRPRPDEVVQFGGSLGFHRAFEMGHAGKGFSFLCGHCSMGYLFFAFFFLCPGAKRWIVLAATIAFGLLIGVGRVAQGAHFPSDVLLDATLMFTVGAALSPIAALHPGRAALPRWKVATISIVAIVLTVGAFLFSTPVLKEWSYVWIRQGERQQAGTRQELYIWHKPDRISFVVDKGDVEVSVRQQSEPLIIESVVKGFGFPGSTSENVIDGSSSDLSFKNRLRGWFWEVHGHFRVWIADGIRTSVFVKTGEGKITMRPPSPEVPDSDRRARDIVSKMTLDEKLIALHGIHDRTHNRYVPGIPRLGIPELRITNGPAGAGPDGAGPQPQATALPAPILLAATWDRQLARLYGQLIGREARLLGNGLVEGPTINIARVPQNGRTFEGFGEDPTLSGQISAEEIVGIQSQHVIADVKHYAANNQETDRRSVNEEIDERALREIYLPAFETSIKQGHAGAVMCAYPQVNGIYCCEHAQLMNTILKKEWDFPGFVTSDFHAMHSSAAAALAGVDLEMPAGDYFGDRLKKEIESGVVPISIIDDKLARRFRTMMQLGVSESISPAPLPEKEDGALARSIAEQGIVLLKNNGLLPLRGGTLKSIALIGPRAVVPSTGGGGSSHVRPLYAVDPQNGIRSRISTNTRIIVVDGSDVFAAADAAQKSEVAIVMIGDDDREGHDQSLQLPDNQDDLVRAVIAANPRTVVVVKSGSAVLMPWADTAAAILEAWYPGEEDGNAVAAVLFGEVNPSAKLPITFPKRVENTFAANREQYPGVHKLAKYSEGVFVGYRSYDDRNIEPRFPFGYGLSYTTFAFRNLRVNRSTAPLRVQIEFDIANTGGMSGAEVAQVYVALPSSADVRQPPKQLRAFEKVSIEPSATAHVQFTLDETAFRYWDAASHSWKTAPGTYEVFAGSSSRDLPLRARFEIEGTNGTTVQTR